MWGCPSESMLKSRRARPSTALRDVLRADPITAAAGGPCSASRSVPGLFRSRLHPSIFGMVGADFRPQADFGSMLSPRYPRHKHSGQTWRSFRDTGRSGPEVRMGLEATSHMRTPSKSIHSLGPSWHQGAAACGGWKFTTLRSPPAIKVRRWSCHVASALRISRSYVERL